MNHHPIRIAAAAAVAALSLLAGAVSSGRLLSFVAIPGFLVSVQPQIEAEEDALADRFGSEYEQYRSQVRRWL